LREHLVVEGVEHLRPVQCHGHDTVGRDVHFDGLISHAACRPPLLRSESDPGRAQTATRDPPLAVSRFPQHWLRPRCYATGARRGSNSRAKSSQISARPRASAAIAAAHVGGTILAQFEHSAEATSVQVSHAFKSPVTSLLAVTRDRPLAGGAVPVSVMESASSTAPSITPSAPDPVDAGRSASLDWPRLIRTLRTVSGDTPTEEATERS